MSHRLIVWMEFSNAGQALDAYNEMLARAVNTSVLDIGTAKGRQSYARLTDETGEAPVLTAFWSKDRFNIVREGEPDTTEPPLWIRPTGAQDAYPLLDAAGNPTRVTHNGSVWEASGGWNANTIEPGTNAQFWQEV